MQKQANEGLRLEVHYLYTQSLVRLLLHVPPCLHVPQKQANEGLSLEVHYLYMRHSQLDALLARWRHAHFDTEAALVTSHLARAR